MGESDVYDGVFQHFCTFIFIVYVLFSNCLHLQGQLCQRHFESGQTQGSLWLQTMPSLMSSSLHTMKPSNSSRWLSTLTWLSLCISQHSYKRWEAGQRPKSFQEERKYSAVELKSRTTGCENYKRTT